MWNPDTYRDTDYGLDDDERFEPADSLEEEFVPAGGEAYIQTILGPIRPDEAGVSLVREFLQWSQPTEAGSRLDNVQSALLDLEAFFSASGRTIVSATTSGEGRDASRLLWLAQHAPVHIVAATGFSARNASAERQAGGAAEPLLQVMERDITTGMDGTACRAGILTVSIDDPGAEAIKPAVGTVADASRKHDMTVLAEASEGGGALELLRQLVSHGADPGRILSTFHGLESDLSTARELLSEGASVLFGSLGNDDHLETASSIAALVSEGYRDRILLSHGFNRRSQLTGYGGRPGLGYVVEYFAVMLLEAGLEAQDVRGILVDNAARVLSIRHRA